jgi:hypothetical protein
VNAQLRKPDRRVFSEALKLKNREADRRRRACARSEQPVHDHAHNAVPLERFVPEVGRSSCFGHAGDVHERACLRPTDGSSDAIRIAELERKVGQQTLGESRG